MTVGEGNADLHFWITRGMARRLGINLTEAMQQGRLSHADLAEMVALCRGCPGAQGCLSFLSDRPDRVGAAPDWCRISRVLAELRAQR